MELDYKKIGKFIAELRREKNMTQEKLGELLFVDRTTISKWELGQNNINTEILIKISKIFNITLNEIIVGEKIKEKNIEKINNITIKAINKNKTLKRYLTISIAFIALLTITFLAYYFINNYNSIVVYEIHGESDELNVHDGLFLISRDKLYIQLGNFKNSNDKKITTTKLYYLKNGEEFIFFEDSDINILYTTSYKESIFKYEDLKYVLANLYLKIIYEDNGCVDIKLELKKSYANNNLFTKKYPKVKQEEINDLDKDIPKYVKNNYKFDEEEKKYFLEKKYKDLRIEYKYFYEVDVYIIEEFHDGYIIRFTYSYPDITYSKMKKDNEIDEFVYEIENKKCLSGSCDKKIINYFKEKYQEEINKVFN